MYLERENKGISIIIRAREYLTDMHLVFLDKCLQKFHVKGGEKEHRNVCVPERAAHLHIRHEEERCH